MHEPRLLILDEPTAGVDIELRRSMWGFLQEINAAGTTIILTTHYLEEAENLCRNLAIIDHGRIVTEGPMRSLLAKLDVEGFLFDIDGELPAQLPVIEGTALVASDDHTLDMDMPRAMDLNRVFAAFDAAGVHPDDFRSLTDLARFPFTNKQDLRDNYPYGMFAVPREEVVRIHASSGTTGKPTVVGYTQADVDMWADLMARSIYAGGGRKGDIAHVAYGYGLFTGGLGAHYGAERLGCTVIPMSGGQTEKQVQLICDFKPTIILVTPSYMLNIADELRRQGVDPKSTALRIGMHGAEPWTDAMRAEIDVHMRRGLDTTERFLRDGGPAEAATGD